MTKLLINGSKPDCGIKSKKARFLQERSSPIPPPPPPPKVTRQDENYYLTEETVDRKGGQDQLAADSNPRIKVICVSKEHIHSGCRQEC